MIIQNIPDELAVNIPRVHLQGFSSNRDVITKLNQKEWKRQQVELFFNLIATESATTELGSPNNLSSSVLQGFSCTSVREIKKVQIKNLIMACRRKGKSKVKLVETQLTCMYNYIKGDSDATTFTLYPPDVLLHYDYSLVPQASCRSYFEQLGDADFSLFSSALSYKQVALFNNARSCLGITNANLTEDNVLVLGNMCCMLDGSYIQNSDPSIIEKLKSCQDLTEAQAAAVEALLASGKTKYKKPSLWTEATLKDLGMLPLYMRSTFYAHFDKKMKGSFLKYFLTVVKTSGVSRQKIKKLKKEITTFVHFSLVSVTNCTVGMISQVTVSDDIFPFDYDDINQFNCCLEATTVSQNLEVITQKVDQEEYLKIVLSKLREAYSSTVPEDQVQLLSAASRVATVDDINSWTITQIDTLAALMDSSNGAWDPNLAKAIITKYLSVKGNKLGSAELNAIGGPNLCFLDVDVLKLISQQSLKEADALNLSSCTREKQRELFNIASLAFSHTTRSAVPVTTYQLTQPYIGGATASYIQSLIASNVNMDLATFTSLNETIVLNLSVSDVRNLLGTNLPDLKSYENQSLVQSWIRSQYQSQLDTLGLGLVGGKADPTVSITSPTSSPTTSSSSTTKGNGSRIQADAGLFLLVFLGLLLTSHQTTV
ncbi:mesothelin-like protein [Xenentodon cancila]